MAIPKDIPIGGNDLLQVVLRDERLNYRTTETMLQQAVPDQRGCFAMDLIRHWGMVAAQRGKDTDVGRPTLELLSVEQVVDRAFEIAESAWDELGALGWLVTINRPEPPAAEPTEPADAAP